MKHQLNSIKSLISNTWARPFVRNFSMVATGATIVQAIAVLFSPILTRLYSPEVFGITGVLISIIAVTLPLSTLTYTNALVLPKSDEEAIRLIKLSMCFASFISVLIFFLVLYFGETFTSIFNIKEVEPYLLFIPFFTFLNASGDCFNYWLIRKGKFKGKTIIGVITSVFENSSKALFGINYAAPTTMLSLALLSNFFGSLFLLREVKKAWPVIKNTNKLKISETLHNYKKTALAYKDFPLLRAPQIIINTASQALPIILLASFFGPASAGFYGIARRLVALPIALIGAALASVIYPRLAAAIHKEEKFDHLVLQATIALACIGIIPYAVLFVTGPWLFQFVFGEEWVTAGIYAKWMSLWLFFGFINIPSVQSIPIIGIQQWFLKYEIISSILRISTIFFGFFFFGSDVYSIILLSVLGSAQYIYLIVFVYFKNRSFAKRYESKTIP